MNTPSNDLFDDLMTPPPLSVSPLSVDPSSYFTYEISNISDVMTPPSESSYLVFDPSAKLDVMESPDKNSGYESYINAPMYALELPEESSSYMSFNKNQSITMRAPAQIEDDAKSFRSAALSSPVDERESSDKKPTLHGLLTPLAHVLGSFAGEMRGEPKDTFSSGFRWKYFPEP